LITSAVKDVEDKDRKAFTTGRDALFDEFMPGMML